MLESIKLFCLLFLMDVIWTRLTQATVARAPGVAAAWSTSLYLLSTYAVYSVIHDLWLLVPAAAGAYLGTYVAVKWSKKNG